MPTRLFYTVADLGQHWNVDLSQIWQWLIDGRLPAHARLPLMSVFRLDIYIDEGAIRERRELRHWEGHAALNKFHCLRLFQSGRLTLREIICKDEEARFVLPDEADDLVILDQRVVILASEKSNFERDYSASLKKREAIVVEQSTSHTDTVSENIDLSFRSVDVEGERYYFGEMQAAILLALHEAAQAGEPWQNGKQILHQVGSQSFTLANVFQGKPIWRQIVESDGRGYYRLKVY